MNINKVTILNNKHAESLEVVHTHQTVGQNKK